MNNEEAKLVTLYDKAIRGNDNKYGVCDKILYILNGGQWKIMVPENMVEDLEWASHKSITPAGPYKCYQFLSGQKIRPY